MSENKHHLFFQRSWYQSALDKQFRNHDGLVLPMEVELHGDLHAHVRPPMKPVPWMMHEVMAVLDSSTNDSPLWAVEDTIDYMATQMGGRESFLARRIHDNLTSQLGFLILNQHMLEGAA